MASTNCTDNHYDHVTSPSLSRKRTKLEVAEALDYDQQDRAFYILYFIGRYLVILTSFFICSITILYAIGSLISLEATSFFCPVYTEAEVRQHNFQNGLNEGEGRWDCWFINQKTLNFPIIYNLDLDLFVATLDNITPLTIIQTSLYLLLAIILIIPTIYHSYLLLYDTFFAIMSALTRIETNTRITSELRQLSKKLSKSSVDHQNNGNLIIDKVCCICINVSKCFGKCYKCYSNCYFRYVQPFYYVDSKGRMLSIIFREWIEIIIQFYGLLLYSGINVLRPNSNVLSQEPHVIETFAIVIASNSVIGM